MLKAQIVEAFTAEALTPVKFMVDLSEACTTDWMSEAEKK